jgi:hypothetical protein
MLHKFPGWDEAINYPRGVGRNPQGVNYYQQEAPSHTGYVFLGSRAETYANSRFGPEGQEIKAGGTAPKD